MALGSMWVSMRMAVGPVLWRHPTVPAPLGGLVGACFSLSYIRQGILFSSRERSVPLYGLWAPQRVVVECGEALHLKLELVERL